MAYDKFNVLTSSAVPLPIENVDTDQIMWVFKHFPLTIHPQAPMAGAAAECAAEKLTLQKIFCAL